MSTPDNTLSETPVVSDEVAEALAAFGLSVSTAFGRLGEQVSFLSQKAQRAAENHAALTEAIKTLAESNRELYRRDTEMMSALAMLAQAQTDATAAAAEGHLANQYLLGAVAEQLGCRDVYALVEGCRDRAQADIAAYLSARQAAH